MKKLFAILLVTVLSSCVTALEPPKSNTDYKNIIGKPIKIGNIEVAQYDFPDQMNWNDAEKACTELGTGWRLPNKVELELIYENKNKVLYENGNKIGWFADGKYWSFTEDYLDRKPLLAWYHDFGKGYQGNGTKQDRHYVRAIRSTELLEELSNMSLGSFIEQLSKYLFFSFLIIVLIIIIYVKINPSAPQNPNSFLNRILKWIPVIARYMPANILRSRMDKPMDKPALLIIGNLEIYTNDFPSRMEWIDAKVACEALGDGWRLPTKDELNILYQNRKNIGGFDIVDYWSSSEFAYMYAWKQNFFTGIRYFKRNTGRHRYSYNVRAVRSLL